MSFLNEINDQLFNLERTFLVYPARFVPSKGHMLLLNAFSSFAKIHKNTYLLLVGTDLKENLYKLVEDLNLIDRVIFYGPSSNINNLLSRCHYGVFPSQYEGHSLALCEMMASGLPIVASDIDPVKYITNNGKGALLFKQDSVDDLILKMNRLYSDKDYAHSLSIIGKKIIKEQFSAFQMLDSHLSFYGFIAKMD
jgi:glycosyltransferase involved in cell wall biosynthesis